MRIVFNKDFDGHKAGKEYYVERSLARRFCEDGIAIPIQKHLDNLYEAEQAVIAAKKKELAEKAKADAKIKAEKEKAADEKKEEPVKKVYKREKEVKK